MINSNVIEQVANGAVIEIMIYKINYKGVIIYVEQLNARYLINFKKRQS
jgi:hypothetical protein